MRRDFTRHELHGEEYGLGPECLGDSHVGVVMLEPLAELNVVKRLALQVDT